VGILLYEDGVPHMLKSNVLFQARLCGVGLGRCTCWNL